MSRKNKDERLTTADNCYLCGCADAHFETHHCLSGSYRKLADKYGLTVKLCPECHRFVHSGNGATTKRRMAAEAQQRAMDKYGWSLDTWLSIFNKSWI